MLGKKRRLYDEAGLLKLLRSRVKRIGGQSAFARETGVDRTYLNTILKGRKNPGAPSILKALKLRLVYTDDE